MGENVPGISCKQSFFTMLYKTDWPRKKYQMPIHEEYCL